MPSVRVAGADVSKGKWVVVILSAGRFERARLVDHLETFLHDEPSVRMMGVDMPIGLPSLKRPRECDTSAREMVKPLGSTVFNAPPARLLREMNASDANRLAKSLESLGVSSQAFALKEKIREVARVARRDDRLYEVHPEVSFVAANNNHALTASKHTWAGVEERRAILRRAGISIPVDLKEAGGAGVADVLDAAIAAWSARRISARRAQTLPQGSSRTHTIWY